LTGHSDFKAVTPVTSVAAFMEDASLVNAALGIDISIDVFTFDPVANKGDGGINDYLYEKGNQLTVLAFALQNITNNLNTTTETTQDYFKAITEEIEKEYTETETKVDIETEAFVTKALDNVIAAKSVTIDETAKENVTKVISGMLPIIQVKSSDDLTTAVIRFAVSTLQTDIQAIANGTAAAETVTSYTEDLLNYIAEDQNVDSGKIAPDINAIADNVTTSEDTEVEINVLLNDSYVTSSPFSLSATNGINGSTSISNNLITYSPNADYNGSDSFSYTITQGDKTSSADVTVTIEAVNDAPSVDIASTIQVAENQTAVTTVSVSDVDEDELTLTLGGTDADSFNLSDENVLTFKEAPDYETKTSYSITLTLTDGTQTVPKDITIAITNVNDVAPEFTSDATFSIEENKISVGTVTATDSEGDNVSFSISGSELVITAEGVLTFVSASDYETKSEYTATVTASDGVNETTQDISITIINVNDNFPLFSSSTTFSADENQTAVGTVTATDADGDGITFTISGTELEITSAGVLTFVSAPDYETKSEYTATVTASDGANSSTQVITIKVINLNDNDPRFSSDPTFSANENQTAVGTVTATDADGDEVTFSISGSELAITSEGVLTFVSAPDYETQSEYTATVSASDGVNETTQDITINIINLIEITAEENININENTQTAEYNITDAGGSSIDLEIIRDYGKDFTPTNTIGNSDGTNFVLNDDIVINDGEIYQALSDIQIGDGASITIKAGGKLISKYVEVDGSYSRPPFSTGTTFTNTYGEGIVLVSNDGTNYEEENSVGNQNILLFDGSSFVVEGTKNNPAEIRNISVAFATKETSDNASINIDYVNWRGGSLHPFFFYRTNAQSSYIRGSLKLTNSYLSFVNSVNLMRLDRRERSEDIVIEDNVFHNSGGFSLDFNYRTSGLLRIQRNLYFGEDVYRTNKPAFLSIGITGGTSQQYPKHTDDRTKVLFKDNAILATPDSSKAIFCENYDAYVPWEANYFGYTADFENTVRKTITDKSSDLSKTCSYPNSLILLEPPRTWDIKPDFYFTQDDKIIMDVPVDYESATNKIMPFNIKATNSNNESKVLDMQMTVIDIDEPAEPIISEILDQISVQENTVFVSNFSVKSGSNDTVTMSLSGDDADKFEVSSNNLLAFKTAPNYEVPTDTDTNNIYDVTLTADTGSASTSIDIIVTVTNQIEESNSPVISDLSFNPESVNVTSESKDVVIKLKITDESGVEQIYQPRLYPYTLQGDFSVICPDMSLTSGTNKDGEWSTTCTIPAGHANDDFYFGVGFKDANGITAECYSSTSNGARNCRGIDESYLLEVINESFESNSPVISDLSFNPESVNVTSESKDVVIKLKITDESGVEQIYQPRLYPYTLQGDFSVICPDMSLTSGTNKDGEWSTTCTIPAGHANDDFYFGVGFKDANGITAECYSSTSNGARNCRGIDESYLLEVINESFESNSPVISDLSFNPESVNVTSESKDVVIKLKITDESGVEQIYQPRLYPYTLQGDFSVICPDMSLTSGTNKDGEWSTTCTIPAGHANDDFYFGVGFKDANGITAECYSSISNGARNCRGIDESYLLEVINKPSSTTIYYLYGGADQSDYLGCYGCANTSSDSVCNSVGTYGSNVSSSSIWNTVGSYGSTVGTYSPWNSVSTSPPEFFNQDKTTTYGKFTVNTGTANRTTVTKLTNIIDYFNNNSSDIAATREYACEQTQSAAAINSLSSNKPNLNLSNKVIFD
jgi:serralysin